MYGDQELLLARDEKPLLLFKQLDKEGKNPLFKLRKFVDAEVGTPPQKEEEPQP